MAALSVHNQIGGICNGQVARIWIEWRNARFADTPPAMSKFLAEYCFAALMVLVTSTSTTAAWKLAAKSATGRDFLEGSIWRTSRITAVFNPLKEKSQLSSSQARGKLYAGGFPSTEAFWIEGPPGYSSPIKRP